MKLARPAQRGRLDLEARLAQQGPKAKSASPDHLEQRAHLERRATPGMQGQKARLALQGPPDRPDQGAKPEPLGLRAKPALREPRGTLAQLAQLAPRAKSALPARLALRGRQDT